MTKVLGLRQNYSISAPVLNGLSIFNGDKEWEARSKGIGSGNVVYTPNENVNMLCDCKCHSCVSAGSNVSAGPEDIVELLFPLLKQDPQDWSHKPESGHPTITEDTLCLRQV